eukprot:10488988-Heterocapsa_arctica.AAC.1
MSNGLLIVRLAPTPLARPTMCSSESTLRPSHKPRCHRASSFGCSKADGSLIKTGLANGTILD